jgi:DNA-binding NarL/FixJ family response regulator
MCGTAALIAAGEARDAIVKLLDVQGLQASAFMRLEDVPSTEEHDAPKRLAEVPSTEEHDAPLVVVLWAQGRTSSLGRQVRSLAQHFEGAPVIVVCEGIERWEIRSALASGAAGVVLYDELDAAFGPCLQAVLAGQTCVPQAHSAQIEPPALSTREKQILGLVVMGCMNSQIAERLYLAESTVKSHLSSAFGKLGVRSRNEAVKLIVDPDNGLGLGILGLEVEPVAKQ